MLAGPWLAASLCLAAQAQGEAGPPRAGMAMTPALAPAAPRERPPAFRAPTPTDPGARVPARQLGQLTPEQRRRLRDQIRATHGELQAGRPARASRFP